tara:strand:+ start:255 stop:758 length:504 start_codon:yes stop_codon:yes gene_type:complete
MSLEEAINKLTLAVERNSELLSNAPALQEAVSTAKELNAARANSAAAELNAEDDAAAAEKKAAAKEKAAEKKAAKKAAADAEKEAAATKPEPTPEATEPTVTYAELAIAINTLAEMSLADAQGAMKELGVPKLDKLEEARWPEALTLINKVIDEIRGFDTEASKGFA